MDTLRTPAMSSFSVTVNERYARVKHILAEIRSERPLGNCPLFKMSLTFPSFVWAPIIDSVYSFHTEQSLNDIKGAGAAPKKPLQKSYSAISSKCSPNCEVTVNENNSNQIAMPLKPGEKDLTRLKVLPRVAISSAIKMKTTFARSQQSQSETQRSHKLGAIPKYLTTRKAEWAQMEEEKLKNIPDPDCPSGHAIMPEYERLQTLNRLNLSQLELNEEFNRLPLCKDSLKIRQKKEDIEKQLLRVEEGIRVLSKPKVFVRLDG